MKLKNLLRFLILMGVLGLASCSDDDYSTGPDDTSGVTATFSSIKANVFPTCTDAQCHSSAGHQANLILAGDVAYGNLVGVQSVLYPQYKRVEPGSSANSLIIKILRGEVNPRMPLGKNPLPSATIDSIAAWIDRGALNN